MAERQIGVAMIAQNEAESAIAAGMASGSPTVLDGQLRALPVRARFLRSFLVPGPEAEPPSAGRMQVHHAMIVGTLDLAAATVDRGILLADSTFDSELVLADADLANLRLPGCVMPGIDATNLHVSGSLELNEGFVATLPVTLIGGRIDGDLRLSGATFNRREPEDDLGSPKAVAFRASRLTVGGALLGKGLVSHGQIRLISARVGGLFSLAGATIENRLVGDDVELPERSEGRAGISLQAERMEVGESVFLQSGFSSDGRVYFLHAHIGGGIDGNGSSFSGGGGRSCLHLVRATVGRNVALRSSQIDGGVSLSETTVGGRVLLTGASFSPGGYLRAKRLEARTIDLRWAEPPASVDLRHSRFATIEDDRRTWPERLDLRGCSYEAIEAKPEITVAERLPWLRLDRGGYRPQPYDQLASAATAMGDDVGASRVALEKQRHRRSTLPWARQVVGAIQDGVVGYGYRPWLAAIWLLPMLAVGTLAFAANPPLPQEGAPPFQAFVFTLDVLLPIVDLGQGDSFTPLGWTRWLAWTLIIFGWTLTTALAAGIARVLQRP